VTTVTKVNISTFVSEHLADLVVFEKWWKRGRQGGHEDFPSFMTTEQWMDAFNKWRKEKK
jgi:hypothetical protein